MNLPWRLESDPSFDDPPAFLVPSHFWLRSIFQPGIICLERLIFTADPLAANIDYSFSEIRYGVANPLAILR